MGDYLAENVLRRFSTADSYKQRTSGLYQTVSNLMGNGHQFSWNNSAIQTLGNDQTAKYYDSSPITYRDIMCAMIIGFGANPMTDWFNLGLMDKTIDPEHDTLAWLDEERDYLLERLHIDGGYECLQKINPGFVDYGTGPFYIGEHEPDGKREGFQGFHFMAVPLQNLWFVEDQRGQVNGCWRREWLTGYEAVERFYDERERLPDAVKKAAQDLEQYSRFAFINEVLPETGQPGKWRSSWVSREGCVTIRSKMLDYFPYIVPRDDVFPGEIYPRGRSVKMLATIKEQNELSQSIGYATGYRARPPVFVRHGTKLNAKALTPGGLVAFDGERPEPFDVGGELNFWQTKYGMNDQILRRGYFVDQLELAQERLQDMKATVAIEKAKMSRIVLGPLFVHLEHQLYRPLISTMLRLHIAGMTDKEKKSLPRQILQAGELDVEVVSPMAKAQQQVDLEAMNAGISYILNMAPVFPELRDVLNPDQIAKNIAMLTNTKPNNFRSPREVIEIRTVKQRIQLQQMQLQAMATAAPAVKDIADAQAVSQGVQ